MGDHADHIHVGWRPLLGSNAKLGRAGAAHPVGQPVGPLRRPHRATSATRSCAPSRRSTRSRSSASAPRASSARATPTWASSRAHGVLRGSSSGSASSTSPSRSGRLTAATSHARRRRRSSPWSCSPRCTPSARRACAAAGPASSPPGAERARAGPDHARDGDRGGAVRRRGRRARLAGALPRPRRARAATRSPMRSRTSTGRSPLTACPPRTRTPTTCRATRPCGCGSATGAAPSSSTAPGTTRIVVPAEHGRPRVRRRMLAPEQELAGILTGRRSGVQPSEELLLRARLDLDARPQRRGGAADARRRRGAARRAGPRGAPARRAEQRASKPPPRLSRAALAGELSEEQATSWRSSSPSSSGSCAAGATPSTD